MNNLCIFIDFLQVDTDRPRSIASIDRHYNHFIHSTSSKDKHNRQQSEETEHLITPHSEASHS